MKATVAATPSQAPALQTPTFRAATSADLADLRDLYRQLVPDANPSIEAMQDALDQIHAVDDGGMVVVADSGGRIIGTCQVVIYHNLVRAPRVKAEIDSVVVHQDFRGRGVGKAMMAWAMDELARRNCEKIIVATHYSREVAHRLYSGMGFEEFGYSFVYTRPVVEG